MSGLFTNGGLAKLAIGVLGTLCALGITGAFLMWGDIRETKGMVQIIIESHEERIRHLERRP